MLILACPSHIWTLAMPASCSSALVAPVARKPCTHSPAPRCPPPWRICRPAHRCHRRKYRYRSSVRAMAGRGERCCRAGDASRLPEGASPRAPDCRWPPRYSLAGDRTGWPVPPTCGGSFRRPIRAESSRSWLAALDPQRMSTWVSAG